VLIPRLRDQRYSVVASAAIGFVIEPKSRAEKSAAVGANLVVARRLPTAQD
jgi:hypothetical protein